MRTVTLNNGIEMPVLGFGVHQIPPEQTEKAVTEALAVGYRLLDTAAVYGNEEAVGRAIRSSGVPRDQLFVTTKQWIENPGEDSARRAFGRSLDRLGLDYLDLYLLHQPYGDVYSFWRALEGLNREGSARAIGVSNFYLDRLVDLIEHNDIVPAVNQVETHPFFQRSTERELMRELGVCHQSWSPLAAAGNDIFTHPVLTAIGQENGKSVAQIALRWLLQREVVVIPKSVHADRMAENMDVFDFALTEDQMARIATLDTGKSLFLDHRDPAVVSAFNGHRLTG